jgi:hypothetical protein
MQVAIPLFERCDDSSVIGVIHDACALLGEIVLAAAPPSGALTDAVVEALSENGYGQYDGLIAILTPARGPRSPPILSNGLRRWRRDRFLCPRRANGRRWAMEVAAPPMRIRWKNAPGKAWR